MVLAMTMDDSSGESFHRGSPNALKVSALQSYKLLLSTNSCVPVDNNTIC